MRAVSAYYVQAGEILAQPIIDAVGRVLLSKGVKLTDAYIKRLQNLGCSTLFIEDSRLDDVEIQLAIQPRTREKAFEAVKSIRNCVESNRLLRMKDLKSVIQRMIADLLGGHDVLGYLSDVKGYDEYTFHHSINTAILALVLGVAARYKEPDLLELGLGSLMHDVGKIKIPAEILNKKEPLKQEEMKIIQEHPGEGYKILRQNDELGLIAAHIAFQHHEKWDGSGYPRGLKGLEIHEYGRITGIADVYDALTSTRVYRNANEPSQAYEYLIANSGVLFDPKMVEIFTRHIAIYPDSSGVLLSNGQRGNVVKQNVGYPSRPFVRVLYDHEEQLNPPVDIDLLQHPSIVIVGVDNR